MRDTQSHRLSDFETGEYTLKEINVLGNALAFEGQLSRRTKT